MKRSGSQFPSNGWWTSGIPIFIYHGVYRREAELASIPSAERRYFLSLEQFENHLNYLAEQSFHTCLLEDCLRSEKEERCRSVALTFDDGHVSNYEWVWPMLLARGFRATFYVVARWVGQPRGLAAKHLREMVQSGMAVGSHGLTHVPLPPLTQLQLDSELVCSKEILQEILGVEIRSFAIPGGFFSERVLERARQASYECVCTSVPGLSKPGFVLNRLSVTYLTCQATFRALANRSPFELGKRRAVYGMIQGYKRLLGINRYERVCQKLLQARRYYQNMSETFKRGVS